MTQKMHKKVYKLDGSEFAWDCDTMHIKCFCHKMALVVNAGLNELGLEAPPPPKLKKAFLGAVPYANNLKPIAEEDEDKDAVEEEGSDCDVDTDDVDGDEADMNEDDDDDDAGNKKDNEENDSNNRASQDDSNNRASQGSNKKKNSATNRNESNKLHELTQNVCNSFFYCFCISY